MAHDSHLEDGHARPGAAGRSAAVLDTRRITAILFAVAALFAVVGAIVNVVIYQVAESPDAAIARVLFRFDLGHEPSVPAWFSSGLLLLDSAMLILIGWAKRLRNEPFAMHWLVLGIVFLGLSVDEAALFHEMLDTLLSETFDTSGFLLFPWVVAGLIFVLAFAIAYLKFLVHLPRRFAFLFVASGALYVGGAVGMELISAAAIDRYGVASLAHTVTQTIEESLEMAGAILFFYTLTEYWAFRYGPLRIAMANPAAMSAGD